MKKILNKILNNLFNDDGISVISKKGKQILDNKKSRKRLFKLIDQNNKKKINKEFSLIIK